MKELPIFYEEKPVATLLQNDRGFCELRYEAEWQRQGFDISVTLPRTQQHHTGDVVRAFFENLLPESAIRESLARHDGVSSENIFALVRRRCCNTYKNSPPPLWGLSAVPAKRFLRLVRRCCEACAGAAGRRRR